MTRKHQEHNVTDTADNTSTSRRDDAPGDSPCGRLRRVFLFSYGDDEAGGLLQFIWIALLVLVLFFMGVRFGGAAELDSAYPAPQSPTKALVSFQGANVLVEGTIALEGDGSTFRLVLPGNAADFAVEVEDGAITRKHEQVVPGLPGSSPAYERLHGQKALLSARALYLEKAIGKIAPEDARAISLVDELGKVKEDLRKVEAALAGEPKSSSNFRLVTLTLAKKAPGSSVKVRYGYQLPDCRWQPRYHVDAALSASKGDETPIRIRLEAQVTQNTGFDWQDTELTLVSSASGYASLPDMNAWLIGEGAKMQPRGRVQPLARNAVMAMKADAAAAPEVVLEEGTALAQWQARTRGLPAGTTSVLLAEDTWTEHVVWLARPIWGNTGVFVSAGHELRESELLWPEGDMVLSLDGMTNSRARFQPKDGKLLLSFGQDPRVKLEVVTQPRRTGKEGLISKERVWDFEWTYSVKNLRKEIVDLKIERPLPKSVDEACKVTWTSTPKEEQDKDALVWRFRLAPGQGEKLVHKVHVSAPEDARFRPVAP